MSYLLLSNKLKRTIQNFYEMEQISDEMIERLKNTFHTFPTVGDLPADIEDNLPCFALVLDTNKYYGWNINTSTWDAIGSGAGGVQTVSGVNTDNTDPANPIIKISVDGFTLTGSGTPGDPLVSTGAIGNVLFWNSSDDFSVFYAANSIATLTSPMIVQLEYLGSYTFDAGTYTNCDKVVFSGVNGQAADITFQDGVVFSDCGIPVLLNDINSVFSNTSVPECDSSTGFPYLFVGERCRLDNNGAQPIIIIPNIASNSPYVYNYGTIESFSGPIIQCDETIGINGVNLYAYPGSLTGDNFIICSVGTNVIEAHLYGACEFYPQTGFTVGTVNIYRHGTADTIKYDNTISVLASTNVQDAIDEVVLKTVSIPTLNIDGKIIAVTPLFTIPAGKTFLLTSIWVLSISDTISSGATFTIGSDVGVYSNITQSPQSTSQTTGSTANPILLGETPIFSAGDIIYFNITAGATGTSQSVSVYINGVYI